MMPSMGQVGDAAVEMGAGPDVKNENRHKFYGTARQHMFVKADTCSYYGESS